MHTRLTPLAIALTAAGLLALPTAAAPPQTFGLTPQQGNEVSVAARFLEAFNAGNLRSALGLLDRGAVASDCDYRRVRAVSFTGRSSITKWLRQRFADHDKLTPAQFFNGNPSQPVGVLGVEYSTRRSDTLRVLGFRAGIVPQSSSKIVFTESEPPKIKAFANGPVGGSRELCRPSASRPAPSQIPASAPYILSARQATGVSVVVRFLAAYNAQSLDAALAMFTTDPSFVRYVGVSDCNYQTGRVERFRGRKEVAAWLRSRFADHDRMTLGEIRNVYSDSGPSAAGAGVAYTRRTSNSLSALGFPDGIASPLGTKVGFASRGTVRITQFANAGGDESCHPSAGSG